MSMTSLTAGQQGVMGGERGRRGRVRRSLRHRSTFESGRRSPIATRKSLVGLASAEDLVGRRMHYMTGGLMGESVVPDTP